MAVFRRKKTKAGWVFSGDNLINCKGAWTREGMSALKTLATPSAGSATIAIDGEKITAMDTVGALRLSNYIRSLAQNNIAVNFINFKSEYRDLIALLETQPELREPAVEKLPDRITQLGMRAFHGCQQACHFLSFLGQVFIYALFWLRNPLRIRWRSIWAGIESTGYRAINIIALLSFLIGVVLAYQMGLQLRNYGASIFVVDLLGLSLLREFAPLITAIIVAGRTGSAYAAQIGTMKLNEEIDALTTMGLNPTELLVLPKMLALVIALPLLTVLSEIFGIMGGMLMSKTMLSISYADFLQRFQEAIALKTLMMGLIKTPVFAAIIATIGCFQGMRVQGGAESVGQQTTKSVVQSIFLIIVADAMFSIIYSALGT